MPSRLASGTVALASVLLFGGTAIADVCSTLQQQYLAASPARGAADVAALNRSLAGAQQAARANNCTGGFFLFGPRPSPACNQIMAEVNQLQAAIRQNYSGTRVFAGLGFQQSGPSSRQLRDVLVANGCPIPQTDGDLAASSGSGRYRTLCVRTCDGYYFPMNEGVPRSGFQADEQTCQAMYGGSANASLFVMPSRGDVADASPLEGGKRYAAQPYAFAYRNSYDAACVAQLHNGVAALASNAILPASRPAADPEPGPDTMPLPDARPPRFEDPETLANLAGDLKPRSHVISGGRAVATGPNGFRVVGADYYNVILQQQAEFNSVGIAAEAVPDLPAPGGEPALR